MRINNLQIKAKPFLRWAGGKSWLIKHIDNFLPGEGFNDYFEPFLGGGSIYFYLKSNGLIEGKSYLSDTNKDLINSYKVIKSNFNDLITLLNKHKNNQKFYYAIRDKEFKNRIEQAARFIYLNRTSYNGIYRVNKDGKYNVPYGKRKLVDLYDLKNIERVSELLSDAQLSVSSFSNSLKSTKTNDLVFLDPPYTVAHSENGFIHYNQHLFSWENQIQLSNEVDKLKSREVNFILTNANHSSIIRLYEKYKKHLLSRASTIGGVGAKRTKYKELIITAYEN